MLWLYLHFPHLQLDTLYVEDPQQPVVIIDGQRHQVTQANDAAVAQGIQYQMGLASAATRCSALQVIPYAPEIECQALNTIANWLYLITSDMVLFPPQGLLLKVSNMLALYQTLPDYWHTIQHHLDVYPYEYQYATGISPLSAKLLAEQGWNTISDNPQHILQRVSQQPLTATDLSTKQVQHLARIGIRTIDDLLQLPMPELARRFDIDLVNYMGRLQGQFKHPCQYFRPPEHFQVERELLYELTHIQWLEKPLLALLQQMEHFLRLRNQVAFDIQITLWQNSHQTDGADPRQPKLQLSVQAAQGETDARSWLTLIQLKLESVSLTGPVYRLSLYVLRSDIKQATSQDFWQGVTGNRTGLELISLLQAKLGRENVHKLALTDDPRPEQSTILLDPATSVSPSMRRAHLRPSLLLPRPHPLNEPVTLVQGPERLMTGWWDGQSVTRDYFIARSAAGRWLWIFRDGQKHWFVHGQFS